VPPCARLRTCESGKNQRVPVVRICSSPECSTLTMGEFCLEHEPVLSCPDSVLEPDLEPELLDAALDPVP
jgi:hypothetical protein